MEVFRVNINMYLNDESLNTRTTNESHAILYLKSSCYDNHVYVIFDPRLNGIDFKSKEWIGDLYKIIDYNPARDYCVRLADIKNGVIAAISENNIAEFRVIIREGGN